MLFRIDKLIGMTIGATDGEIGKVKDVYFDDHRWAVRYLVIETGNWLEERKVLISPISVETIDWGKRTVKVRLNKEHVKSSPNFDTDKPFSRQHEMEFFNYYGYPDYWSGLMLWGAAPYPVTSTGAIPVLNDTLSERAETSADPHLRSALEVTGYHLRAIDDSIGHLEDFLADIESWAIRYIVVDTRNWLPGKHVLIPPQWIKKLDWSGKIVHVDVTRNTVQRASKYDPTINFSREHEASLYRHYQRPGYW